MNPLTLEWIEKAEGDFATAMREFAVTEKPNYDAVCYHAQQSAEKYLKAALQERMIEFPKTHDLERLLNLLLPAAPRLETLRDAAKSLSEYAIELRYPGNIADKTESTTALDHCRRVRELVRSFLDLNKSPD